MIKTDGSKMLESLSYPGSDDFSLPTSPLAFSDGSHYGIELSSINNLKSLETVLALLESEGIKVNRVDECRGIFRLPDAELSEMIRLSREKKIDIVLSTGPRAIYDNGGFVRSKNGARMSYRLRGMDNIRYALDEVIRGTELGARKFLIYDEGLLFLLNKLREKGHLPENTFFKLSVHIGCANPISASVYESIGADSINLIPDLDLPMLAGFRQAVSCPLDIFSDTSADAGGFIQTYRVPEIIRLCAPVYLKCGAISQDHQNHLPSEWELIERVKQLVCVKEMIQRTAPGLTQLTNA